MTDRIIPEWEPAPLPGGTPPTPGGSSSKAGGVVGLTTRSLVGPAHRIPILYGRCLVSPDLAMAKQASRSGMRYGTFLAVISEGPIDAIESWQGATTNDFQTYEATLGVLTTPSANLAGMIGLAGAFFEMKNSRPWSPACIARGRKLFDPRLGAWGAGEYPDPTKCAYSKNLALAFADLRTFPQYGDLLPAQVDWQSVEDAADWCDEIVDGAKRYELNLWLTHGDSGESWIETLGLHGGLRWREEGGLWKLDFSQPVATVSATITDDHVFADSTPSASFGGGAGLADRPNRFRAEWIDPASNWQIRTVELRHPEVEAGAPIRDASVYKLHGFHSEAMALRALWRIAHEIWSEQTLELELSTEMLHLQEGSRVTVDLDCLGISGVDYIVTKLVYDGDRIQAAFQKYDTTTWTSPGADGGPLPAAGFFDTPPALANAEYRSRWDETVEGATTRGRGRPGVLYDLPTFAFSRQVRLRCATSQNTPGEVFGVTVVSGGSGYAVGDPVTISGEGASATAAVLTVDGGGKILTVQVTAGGSGYWPQSTIATAGGSGTGAALSVVISSTTDVTTLAWDDPELERNEYSAPAGGNEPQPNMAKGWAVIESLVASFDDTTVGDFFDGGMINGGAHAMRLMVRLESLAGLLGPASTFDQAGISYSSTSANPVEPVYHLSDLTANKLPKVSTTADGRLVDSKLSDDGTTPRYDGNAIYHEGNPPPAGDTFPAGAIVAYGGSAAPDGWLLCDGSAVSRTTHADLFAVLGTSHGAGDGSTTFGLPDLRDRFVRGKGASSAIGSTGGAATHLHAVGLSVGTSGTNARETGDTLAQDASPVSGHLTVDHYHSSSVSGDTGSASSLPPYLVEVWIIKASGTPSAATPHNTLASRDVAGAHPATSISFTPSGTISATNVQAAIEEVAAEAAGGGSPLTVKEDDGTPSVANVTELRFSGATVTDNGAGVVTVSGLAGPAGPAGPGIFAESAVPNMTSNTDPSGTVSASSNHVTTPPWRVFSHDRLGWVSNGIAAPAWVQYQFTSAKTIRAYEVMPWSIDTWPTRALAAWHLDGSNDGSTWTELDARTHAWGWSPWAAESYPIASPAAYTHYRLVITAIKEPSHAYVGLQSLRLFE